MSPTMIARGVAARNRLMSRLTHGDVIEWIQRTVPAYCKSREHMRCRCWWVMSWDSVIRIAYSMQMHTIRSHLTWVFATEMEAMTSVPPVTGRPKATRRQEREQR